MDSDLNWESSFVITSALKETRGYRKRLVASNGLKLLCTNRKQCDTLRKTQSRPEELRMKRLNETAIWPAKTTWLNIFFFWKKKPSQNYNKCRKHFSVCLGLRSKKLGNWVAFFYSSTLLYFFHLLLFQIKFSEYLSMMKRFVKFCGMECSHFIPHEKTFGFLVFWEGKKWKHLPETGNCCHFQ